MTRNSNNIKDMRWSPMLLLSIIFHMGIFSVTLLVPQSMPGAGRFQGIVYEVDLVEMPAGGGAGYPGRYSDNRSQG